MNYFCFRIFIQYNLNFSVTYVDIILLYYLYKEQDLYNILYNQQDKQFTTISQ